MAGRTVSIRELQQNLKRVVARVERGETVEVTRRRKPVARLSPVRVRPTSTSWPDLDARTRVVFGERTITPSASEVVLDDRDDR